MAFGKSLLALVLGSCVAGALVIGALRLDQRRDKASPAAAADLGTVSGTRYRYPAERLPLLALPDGRTQPIRSVLNIKAPMKYGDSVWDERDVPPGPILIRVDLQQQLLSIFRGGHEIGSAVILYGAGDKPSPTGVFPVLAKAKDYHSITYDAAMPYMLRLTADGVAIHGSEVRPGAATHGCIGVPTEFARQLFGQTSKGDLVVIVGPHSG